MNSLPMRPEITHGYIGRCRTCKGWILICGDEPDNAKAIASVIRRGNIIERYTVEEQKKMLREGTVSNCDCPKPPSTRTAKRQAERMAKYVPLDDEGKPK